MAFIHYNANPNNNDTIDCVIREISKVLNISCDGTYIILMWKEFIAKNIFFIKQNMNRYLI